MIFEYYAESGVLDAQPDKEGYVDIDLDKVVDYVLKKAKKSLPLAMIHAASAAEPIRPSLVIAFR